MAYTSETKLTVRYAETDMMGIVHHSRYYPWFELARGDYIKKAGMSYSEMEKRGILLPVTETGAKYYHGLTYEDEVLVTCTMTRLTVARCDFSYKVYKLPEMLLMNEGITRHGFVGRDMVPINLKKLYPDVWESMQALMEDG